MTRKLDNGFVKELLAGKLKNCLDYVRNDDTLDLEIRENYINIYYRGGNILNVNKNENSYQYKFDDNYLNANSVISKVELEELKTKTDWNNYFPKAKQTMDFYFSTIKRNDEKEFQQLVVRENNYSSIANGTDYFIIDIEYDNHKNARFDIIAVEWLSEASKRKLSKNYKPKLVIIEMKYRDDALSGEAGLKKHADDFFKFIESPDLNDFKKEMLDVFKQKRELGLIPCLSNSTNSNEIIEFADDVKLSFLIANHDPASTILTTELSNLNNLEVSIITANFMGYGIYNHSVYNLSKFEQLFESQIQCTSKFIEEPKKSEVHV